jgi:hypothetical protein
LETWTLQPRWTYLAGLALHEGPILAVLPTFIIFGPLMLLASLFGPGGLALFFRRWMVLLSKVGQAIGWPPVSSGNSLQGVPLSAGVAEGQALVLHEPNTVALPEEP